MNKSYVYLVITLSIIKFIFPFFLVDSNFQLHSAEFELFDTAKSFSWGYEKTDGPLLYWISLLQHSFGGNIIAIKFVPALFGALSYFFVGLIVIELGGKLFAVFLAFLPFVLSIYLPVQFSYNTDALTICWFAAITYFIIKYIAKNNPLWLYLFGVSMGLGLLSSVDFVTLLLIFIVSLLISKRYRIIFFSLHFYLAVFIGVTIYLPHINWLLHQQSFSTIAITQTEKFDTYAMQQLLFILGGVFIWIIGVLYIALTPKGREHLPFLMMFIAANVFFFNNGDDAKKLLPLFSILLAFGAYNIERLTTRYVRILRYVSITPLFYVGFMNMPTYMPILPPDQLASLYLGRNLQETKVLVWDDNTKHELPQHFAEMLGYKDIIEKVAKVYHSVNEHDKANTVIVSKNRALAAAINFYKNVYLLPNTVIANDDFYFTSNINSNIVNVVFIGNPVPEKNIELYKNFENSYLAEEFTENNYSKFKGTKIMLYLKANETLNNQVRNTSDNNSASKDNYLADK